MTPQSVEVKTGANKKKNVKVSKENFTIIPNIFG